MDTNNNPEFPTTALDADGIDPNVRALYGDLVPTDVLVEVSNNPFTVSADGFKMICQRLYTLAYPHVKTLADGTDDDTAHAVAHTTVMLIEQWLILAAHAQEWAASAPNVDDRDHSIISDAMLIMDALDDGLVHVRWEYRQPDDQGVVAQIFIDPTDKNEG